MKNVLSAKRWFIMLAAAALAVVMLIATINIVVDPFSVFGDRFFDWHSYGMTNNPKTAKFAYVNARVGEFDAFIVGPSGASGICPIILQEYTGLRAYNMFNYGADMEYTRRLAAHLIETHQPDMVILVVPIISASAYERPIRNIHYRQPLQLFWQLPFLFANPQHSIDKINAWNNRSFLQQSFDVFIAETGVYNKTRRDAEARGSMSDFLAAHPAFANMYFARTDLAHIDENMAAVEYLVSLAAQFDTELIVVTTPMLAQELGAYYRGQVLEFYERLASASGGFWDFSFSAISSDPRFFDDTTHFSNNVGEMMLARIFGDESMFVPPDLGIWVTSENAAETARQFSAFYPSASHLREQRIPILMYHDIVDDDVPPALFAEHMSALYANGFNVVSIYALKDFVLRGVELPPNPVVITFDDGYLSNYVSAFPILQYYGFHATIFPMGISFGRDTHYYSHRPIRPRFGEAEARTMVESGLISLQSHTFDMHHVEGFDPSPIRRGILRMDGESEADYIYALRRDHQQMRDLLEPITGRELFAMAFPYGIRDTLSTVVLRELGVTMTFSSDQGHATLVKGLPQSLLEMNRFYVHGEMSAEELVWMIGGE